MITACKICQSKMKYSTGSTSSITNHLYESTGLFPKQRRDHIVANSMPTSRYTIDINSQYVHSERPFSIAGDPISSQRALTVK